MKKFNQRKIIVLILITVLLLLMLLNSSVISIATQNVEFRVSSATGSNESEVTIAISMQNSAEFVAGNFSLKYDKDKLEYLSSEKGPVLLSGMLHIVNHNAENGSIAIAYTGDPQATSQEVQAGELLRVTFKIKNNVSGMANLNFECTTLKQKDGTDLIPNITQGNVTITKTLSNIELNKTALSLNEKAEETLTVRYIPEDTTDNKTVTWMSSNDSVATVNNGKVTAVKAGTATIIAKVGEREARCQVTVLAPLVDISLDKPKITILKGQTEILKVLYIPENTTDSKNAIWMTSDDTVVTVEEGKVTAINVGTATITVMVGDKAASCEITVTEIPLQAIAIDITGLELEKGKSHKCSIIYNPTTTTDSRIAVWDSDNEKVASVDESGNVTAIDVGTATITAQVGDKTASIPVKVVLPTESNTIPSKENENNKDMEGIQNAEKTEEVLNNPLIEENKISVLPKTGDTAIILYVVLAVVSVVGMIFIIKKKIENKNGE